MLLDRTLFQLDIGWVAPERAEELGYLGYLQWLGALPSGGCYRAEVEVALAAAEPFAEASPAICVFMRLLEASLDSGPCDIASKWPRQMRRGRARRLSV